MFASAALLVTLTMAVPQPCAAFDPASGVSKDSGPFDLFKFGFKASQAGHQSDAVEAFRYAAEKGHTGSRWKLADMYANGDGVERDAYAAFKMYSEIARNGIEPGSADTGYFVNALMSLAHYYQNGIPDSPVEVNINQAYQLYFQVASTFGVAEAQYQLARILLTREDNRSIQMAKKWLNHARKQGHVGATALFGNLIFQEGQTVRGLAFMTVALERSAPKDLGWMRALQEEAFASANEEERRVAVALSEKLISNEGN